MKGETEQAGCGALYGKARESEWWSSGGRTSCGCERARECGKERMRRDTYGRNAGMSDWKDDKFLKKELGFWNFDGRSGFLRVF